jgi:hypothetical protein
MSNEPVESASSPATRVLDAYNIETNFPPLVTWVASVRLEPAAVGAEKPL